MGLGRYILRASLRRFKTTDLVAADVSAISVAHELSSLVDPLPGVRGAPAHAILILVGTTVLADGQDSLSQHYCLIQ